MHAVHKKHFLLFITVASVIKLILSQFIELGNDEAYYYSYALTPSLNYFDHPPMVGLLIRLSTFNLYWVNNITMRLGSIICSAVATWYIFKTVALLKNTYAAWLSAVLYQCSIYGGFIAGWFIMPDSPQTPFWCIALYIMAKFIAKSHTQNSLKHWLILGLSIGLATLSKVHGLYLWAGFGLYILIANYKILFNYRLYISFAVTALCASAILIWNIQNNFITYKFHSKRVASKHFDSTDFMQHLTGEAIYQNPLVYILILISFVALIKGKVKLPKKTVIWLLCMSLPMIFLFWFFAGFNPIFPHWSGPAFVPLIMLAGMYLSSISTKIYPLFLKINMVFIGCVLIAATVIVNFYPNNFGSKNADNYGEYCPTLDVSGWRTFSFTFNKIYTQDTVSKTMQANSPILINMWFPAAQIQLYTATITKQNLVGTGVLQDVHHFAWLNKNRPLNIGQDAYVIVPSNYPIDVVKLYTNYFTSIELAQIVPQTRGGKTVRNFAIWRLKHCKNNSCVVKL